MRNDVDPVSHASVSFCGSVEHDDTRRRIVAPLLAFAHFAMDTVNANERWTEVGVRHASIVQSLIVPCQLHEIDPYAYLVGVLWRVGHPASNTMLGQTLVNLERLWTIA